MTLWPLTISATPSLEPRIPTKSAWQVPTWFKVYSPFETTPKPKPECQGEDKAKRPVSFTFTGDDKAILVDIGSYDKVY